MEFGMDTIKMGSEHVSRKWKVLINRNFALLWSGQAISQLGDVVFSSTLMFWIVTTITQGQRWAPLAVSGLFLAEALATFGAGPLAGVFVDRWEKRRTMLWMDALRSVLILLLLLPVDILPLPFQFVATGQLIAVYLVIFFATTCARFFDPSRLALLGDIVSEPDRARATGLLQGTTNLATVIGPPTSSSTALFWSRRAMGIAHECALLCRIFPDSTCCSSTISQRRDRTEEANTFFPGIGNWTSLPGGKSGLTHIDDCSWHHDVWRECRHDTWDLLRT
jgi:MFS family permease